MPMVEREQAIKKINDGITRKFILTENTLFVQQSSEGNNHSLRTLALRLNLDPSEIRGGNLKAILCKLRLSKRCITLKAATQKDLDNFTGEIELI